MNQGNFRVFSGRGQIEAVYQCQDPMIKLDGTSIPPDATGTLRLSFGAVSK
jgi:hypothetical protein